MRRQTTIIKCDGDGCQGYTETPDVNETPDGWYRIQEARDGKLNPRVAFDLCSLRCVEKWARGRRAFQTQKRTAGSIPQLIMGLFNSDPTAEIVSADVVQRLEANPHTVRGALAQLAADGELDRVKEGRGGAGNGAVYRLASKVPA